MKADKEPGALELPTRHCGQLKRSEYLRLQDHHLDGLKSMLVKTPPGFALESV